MTPFQKFCVFMRYVVIVAFAGWAGAAAAYGMWFHMLFAFAYMAGLYYVGKLGDKQLKKLNSDDVEQ